MLNGITVQNFSNLNIIGVVAPRVVVRIGVDGLPAAALSLATRLVYSWERAVHLVLIKEVA